MFNATFSNISAISWRSVLLSGGGSRSTQREPPPLGKQLANFITCGCCEPSAPFLLFTKLGVNPRCIGDRLVWAVRSNDPTYWATRSPSLLVSWGTHKPNSTVFRVVEDDVLAGIMYYHQLIFNIMLNKYNVVHKQIMESVMSTNVDIYVFIAIFVFLRPFNIFITLVFDF